MAVVAFDVVDSSNCVVAKSAAVVVGFSSSVFVV